MEQSTIETEISLYRRIRSTLREDLVSSHGFPIPVANAILNWFDPANEEYLDRVEAWQTFLCSGAVSDGPEWLKIIAPRNSYGTHTIWTIPSHQVGAIHQVAKIVYKWHGIPRRKTDMEEVKHRLSQTRPLGLGQEEIEGIRNALACVPEIFLPDLKGRFGPGATFEGFNAYEKWQRQGVAPDVPPSFYRVNPRDPTTVHIGDGYTKIAEVPKNIKCNRIVSSEPSLYMYTQLAVHDALVGSLHFWFGNHVSLDNQARHNQALMWDKACSIDLKDASDHNRCELVQAVLPQLWPVLARVRSQYSLFPDGDVIPLTTLAPMGSGICFATMTLVIVGILKYATTVAREKYPKAKLWFKVYGDDVIVPLELYDIALDLLARAGFVVNYAKSCCTTLYRESCGRELLFNTDVTPVFIRDPLDQVTADKIESVVHGLRGRYFDHTADAVLELSSPVRGIRWNSDLQRQEVCVSTLSARQKIRTLDEWDGLNRWFSVHSQGRTWGQRKPSGVASEVWTKRTWRFKAANDYPELTTWFVTKPKGQHVDATHVK